MYMSMLTRQLLTFVSQRSSDLKPHTVGVEVNASLITKVKAPNLTSKLISSGTLHF